MYDVINIVFDRLPFKNSNSDAWFFNICLSPLGKRARGLRASGLRARGVEHTTHYFGRSVYFKPRLWCNPEIIPQMMDLLDPTGFVHVWLDFHGTLVLIGLILNMSVYVPTHYFSKCSNYSLKWTSLKNMFQCTFRKISNSSDTCFEKTNQCFHLLSMQHLW